MVVAWVGRRWFVVPQHSHTAAADSAHAHLSRERRRMLAKYAEFPDAGVRTTSVDCSAAGGASVRSVASNACP